LSLTFGVFSVRAMAAWSLPTISRGVSTGAEIP
jgi:hypothetical protein